MKKIISIILSVILIITGVIVAAIKTPPKVVSLSEKGLPTEGVNLIAHRGFSNYPFKKEYVCINLVELEAKFADGETVNKDTLKAKGMVGKVVDGIKILGNGDLTKKLTVEVSKVSASAKAKIEKAGGSVKVLADSEKKSAE